MARICWWSLVVGVLSLLGMGLYIQFGLEVEPCPLCILQRLAYIAVAVLALAAIRWAPRQGPQHGWRLMTAIPALAGLGVAVRQVWLQHFPPKFSQCGADVSYLLETLPINDVVIRVFRGSGDCSERSWELLGMSIAEWSVVCFTLILLLLWLGGRFRRRMLFES